MKILAVEFSSEHRGVAVVDAASGALLGQAVEQGGRCAIELADRALAAAGCEREEIGIVAVD